MKTPTHGVSSSTRKASSSPELSIAAATVAVTAITIPVPAIEDRTSVEDVPWRIEAPSEGPPQHPITREPGITPEAGVPVPTGSHAAVPGILRGQVEIS